MRTPGTAVDRGRRASRAARLRARRCASKPIAAHVVDRGAEPDRRPRCSACRLRTCTAGRSRCCPRTSPCGSCRRRRGTAASRRARLRARSSTPMPVGPYSLWPVNDVEVGAERRARPRPCGTRPAIRRSARPRRRRCASATISATGIDGAERVRQVHDRDDLRPRRQQPRRTRPSPGRRGRRSARPSASRPSRSQSSCHGTMFEWCSIAGDEHFVAGADVGVAPRARDQVDALGGVAGEDDFAHRRRVDERAHLLPRAFVRRRSRARSARARRDGRWRCRARSSARMRVDHLPRLLRRRRVVEIDERLAVHLLLQRRELGADRGDVERRTTVRLCFDFAFDLDLVP